MARLAPRVLFRAAAGPGLGFGHLVRCRTLARALGSPLLVSLRGSDRTAAVARGLGCRLWTGSVRELDGARFDLLVVDDPSSRAARSWVASARRRGLPVASVHDGGRNRVTADMSIDGSSVLDPALARQRVRRARRRARHILVTLGGGRHVRRWGHEVATAILALAPDARISIVQGFGPRPPRSAPTGATWIQSRHGLGRHLATAVVAVVAGGVTLYEACALATPIVVLPVVAAQRPAARACAQAGAARYASAASPARAIAQAATMAVDLLRSPSRRDALSRRAGALVDGRGAARVAITLHGLIADHQAREARHAA